MSLDPNQDLFPDPSLLSTSFISSLTDEELTTQLKFFKITQEESKGTTAFFAASKNFENLFSEAKRRGLTVTVPIPVIEDIVEKIEKESLTKPALPFILYGSALAIIFATIIILKRRKK